MLYQLSKEITKFLISGVIAVGTDFAVYYGLGVLFNPEAQLGIGSVLWNDVFKSIGFIAGTTVTYNLNKYWTWRKTDRDQKRLLNFTILYVISFIVNVWVNNASIGWLPDNEMSLITTKANGDFVQWMAFKTDKFFAFLFSSIASAAVSFTGQKIWVFKNK
ncbi:MAG: GtrA family protein [Flavobacteriales bacterium]|nr:GtrA family protein [Flavobacteriales bacterium]